MRLASVLVTVAAITHGADRVRFPNTDWYSWSKRNDYLASKHESGASIHRTDADWVLVVSRHYATLEAAVKGYEAMGRPAGSKNKSKIEAEAKESDKERKRRLAREAAEAEDDDDDEDGEDGEDGEDEDEDDEPASKKGSSKKGGKINAPESDDDEDDDDDDDDEPAPAKSSKSSGKSSKASKDDTEDDEDDDEPKPAKGKGRREPDYVKVQKLLQSALDEMKP
jgi:hypothetical protein